MVLRGGLSNHPFGDLLQCLTTRSRRKASPQAKKRVGWSDGRRAFGTVSAAVLAVLTESGEEMRAKAIHEEVERLLGSPVSRFSVSDYLLTRARSENPPFERTRYGHYRLRNRRVRKQPAPGARG
jgi:hypothetical protein